METQYLITWFIGKPNDGNDNSCSDYRKTIEAARSFAEKLATIEGSTCIQVWRLVGEVKAVTVAKWEGSGLDERGYPAANLTASSYDANL